MNKIAMYRKKAIRAKTNPRETRKRNWLKHATMKTNRVSAKDVAKKSLFVEKKTKEAHI